MARRWIRFTVATGTLMAALSLAGAASAAGGDVTISGFAFAPASLTVQVGDTVTWTNNDPATHTATGTGWDAGAIASGASGSVTFDTAGTFAYVCRIHPSMQGTIVVQAASGGGVTHGDGTVTAPPSDTVPDVAPAQPAMPPTEALAFLCLAGLGGLWIGGRRVALARAGQAKR